MKKMKFRKLSRVLFSVSLLAIIAVSLISVPVSAVSADYPDLVGQWLVGEDFYPPSNAGVNTNDGYNASIRFPYLNTETNTVEYLEWNSACFIFNTNDRLECGFEVINGYGNQNSQYMGYRSGVIYQKVPGHTATIRLGDEFYDELRVIEFIDDTVAGWDGGQNPEDFYNNVLTYMSPYVPPQPRSLLDNILGTFSEVGSWIGTIISSLVALFWSVETASLTFLGILSVAGLAFSVIMLLFGIVTRFVGFSG